MKKILYIPTQITGTWRYFSWCAYPNIWYSRVQRDVLDLLGTTKDINVFVKFYPNDLFPNPNHNFAKKNPSITILENSLIDILKENVFDLIITEAYATTLLEILCTESQIVLFASSDFTKLSQEAKCLLGKRLFLVETKVDFLKTLEKILNKKLDVKLKDINDEFLFKFGIGTPKEDPILLTKTYLDSLIN